MSKYRVIFFLVLLSARAAEALLHGQYSPVKHREPNEHEIPVSSPGIYDKPGATYVLVKDISSPRTAVFLGKDVTLDLNGYTISFTDGNYEHIPNYGFEEGLSGWDISKAPSAAVRNTAEVHEFIGKKLLSLSAGDEISSAWITLPEANRSYYAICGVTGRYYFDMKGDLSNDMKVSVHVDDIDGKEIYCTTPYADTVLQSCPVTNMSPRLGGGFIFAHLKNLPAGKYRIRVRAVTDCLVDEIDIRPAMDAGIGIVEQTNPLGHYNHLYSNMNPAFFDYTADINKRTPVEGIPVVKGRGTVTIKNGIIRNATESILSRAIQSTAKDVMVILDNLSITSSGINTTAVDVRQAVITNCRFDINNPFIINRHGSEFYAVDLTGDMASEVSYSEFFGGQGCLCFKGHGSLIHHNLFVNRQTVTNHYSIMAMGDGSRIFSNRFEPEQGSGIEIFRKKYIDIFDNVFNITAAPPSCEYPEMLSTNAIRLADYGAAKGAANGCFGNRIYNNLFYISGKKYRLYPDFIPLASAVFYSASAGDNEIFGNRIHVSQNDPDTDAEALAFYIGNANGGIFHNNIISSNVTPVWVASPYGDAENVVISSNTFLTDKDSTREYKPFKIGPGHLASGIKFSSNHFAGVEPVIDSNPGKQNSYTVSWTLNLKLLIARPGIREIIITDNSGNEVFRTSGSDGEIIKIELPEYSVNGSVVTRMSPYTINAGNKKYPVSLNKNTEMQINIR